MAISRKAKKSYKKAKNAKNKRQNKHWLWVKKGDSSKEITSKVITQVSLFVLIICIGILGNEGYISLKTILLNSSLQDLYSNFSDYKNNGEITPHAKELLKINPDTVGWIEIADTNINLPVVQEKNSGGNDYYLDIAFDGTKNKAGTVFLDYRATLTANKRSDNLIVYAHNQKDNTMFGDLEKYKKSLEFYSSHPIISFSSNYHKDTYKIIGCFVINTDRKYTSDGQLFDYHNYINWNDNYTYENFVENVRAHSEINTTVDVNENDKFITLSTCSNEFEAARFVVVARQLRDGEDAFVDTQNATVNLDAIKPEYNLIF